MTALRRAITDAAATEQITLGNLTVGKEDRDPFRMDTPAHNRDGEWVSDLFARAGRQVIHIRGLHYVAVTNQLVKPNGEPYRNTYNDWQWLQLASRYARWLGKIPFTAISDERSDRPLRYTPLAGLEPMLRDVKVARPEWSPIVPVVDGDPEQPNRVVIFAEKSSAGPVLIPLAQEFGLTLYLGTGDPSDSMTYEVATEAMRDGRPLVLLTLCDCDPSGWNMPPTMGRRFQAFGSLPDFEGFEYQVRRIGLSPEQVRDLDLPSSPLKPEERRADRWKEATGTEQTELDALATLAPTVLMRLVRQAIEEVHDTTLASRTREAVEEWRLEAEQAVEAQADVAALEEADRRLDQIADEVEEISEAREQAVEDVMLPDFEPPEAEPLVSDDDDASLVDSRWSWLEQTRALRDSKAYLDAAP